MVVDTSAVLAILQQEPDAGAYARTIATAQVRLISAVSILECGMIARSRGGEQGIVELDALIMAAQLEVVAFDADQAYVAREAFAKFGKGRHPAGLNFGDCAAYALAATQAEPLLYKGHDFALTDLPAVALDG